MTGLRRTVGLGVAATVAAALAVPSGAQAEYGPGGDAASASGTALGSGDSRLPSISDDGRYVVFDTEAPELLGTPADPAQRFTRGLVRRDLRTGAVALVAPPARADADGTPLTAGAFGIAAVSGNGRYVAFDTTEGLTPTDRNGTWDVYVRDMDAPVTDGHAYELASALDGTGEAPAYVAGGSRIGAAGFALSDDGRTAVFFTSGVSNLPAGGAATTPADQVLVRRLDARRTIAITAPVDGGRPPRPVLSGDGGTVAWFDGAAGAQTALLPGEPDPAAALLWRRVDGGPTRRVGGASDLEDPGCDRATPFPRSADDVTGPCFGPFQADLGVDGFDDGAAIAATPSISDDGLRLLVLSTARRRPYDAATARVSGSIYLADLRPGLPRKAAVPRVISVPGGGEVTGAVLSGDGLRVAIATKTFTFDGVRTIGTLPDAATGTTDVWVADLAAGSVQRATTAAGGGDYHGPPVDPDAAGTFTDPAPTGLALDDAAHALAFTADDGNLFVGDANGATDVQVVRGATGAGGGTVTALPVPGAGAPLVAAQSFPSLAAPRAVHPVIGYATVGRDGIARVTVRVPAAGALAGEATTRSGGRTARVARVTRTAKGASTITLRFSPSKAIRKRLRSRAVKATIAIRYKPKAGAATTARRTATYPRRKAAR